MNAPLSRRERRIGRRLAARGESDLFTALAELRGVSVSGRYLLESLHAVGGEGAIYVARDLSGAGVPRRVAKIALAPWHDPAGLSSRRLAERRATLFEEERLLRTCASPFLPRSFGLFGFRNPHIDTARGAEFARDEPCLVLEMLPGRDLDVWACRVHRGAGASPAIERIGALREDPTARQRNGGASPATERIGAPREGATARQRNGVPRDVLRPHLDRIAVGLLQAMADVQARGFLYADLRPGNLRVAGRPARRIRLLDAGALVPAANAGERFPHVPSYLPPQTFAAMERGALVPPTPAIVAAMAGRTLFEVATGQAPKAGSNVDLTRLIRSAVSPPVAEVIAALANGDFASCADALAALAERSRRRTRP